MDSFSLNHENLNRLLDFTALQISDMLDRNLADVTAIIDASEAAASSESEKGPAA